MVSSFLFILCLHESAHPNLKVSQFRHRRPRYHWTRHTGLSSTLLLPIFCLPTCQLIVESSTYCREYLDIIDLTGEPEGSADSDSEIDDLPLAPITMSQPQCTNDRWVVITGVTHCHGAIGCSNAYTVLPGI